MKVLGWPPGSTDTGGQPRMGCVRSASIWGCRLDNLALAVHYLSL